MIVSTDNAEHYRWGAGCDGWVLAGGPDLLIIQERMPPDTAETRHVHETARQFFFVLSGELTMELAGRIHRLTPQQGIEVPPGELHQARNDSTHEVVFLVTSTPTSRGDRIETPGP